VLYALERLDAEEAEAALKRVRGERAEREARGAQTLAPRSRTPRAFGARSIDEAKRQLFVSTYPFGDLFRIDARTGRVLETGACGWRCRNLFFDARKRTLWAAFIPVARGGRSTADNLTLYCRPHNLLQAEKDFGEAHVRRKRLERSVASALIALGFKKREAEQAAVAAVGRLPGERDVGALVRESLRLLAP